MALRGTNIGFSTYGKRTPPYTEEGIDLAKQDLQYAFLTRRGERVMRPDFGTIIFCLSRLMKAQRKQSMKTLPA